MGIAFLASSANQHAKATSYGNDWPRARASSRYAVYVYDVYYSYHVHRGGRIYNNSGRKTSTFAYSDAARVAANLRYRYSNYGMRTQIRKRFWRWSYNR